MQLCRCPSKLRWTSASNYNGPLHFCSVVHMTDVYELSLHLFIRQVCVKESWKQTSISTRHSDSVYVVLENPTFRAFMRTNVSIRNGYIKRKKEKFFLSSFSIFFFVWMRFFSTIDRHKDGGSFNIWDLSFHFILSFFAEMSTHCRRKADSLELTWASISLGWLANL